MRIMYCTIGWMDEYQGESAAKDGGDYNNHAGNIGGEVFNFLSHQGTYYGFFEPGYIKKTGKRKKVLLENFDSMDKALKNAESIDDVLVVFLNRKTIVGWYNNATLYRNIQKVPEDVMQERNKILLNAGTEYNVLSNDAVLLPEEQRTKKLDLNLRMFTYAKAEKEINDEVLEYINNYQNK